MEGFLKNLGLYNVIGVFFSGALFVYIGVFISEDLFVFIKDVLNDYFNTYSLYSYINNSNNNFIKGFSFVLLCYFVGFILKEVSSFLDKKFFKLREKASSGFLNNSNKIFEDELELKAIQKMANKFLNKNEDNSSYEYPECRFFYFHCKTILKNENKDEEEQLLDALFAMSRSLFLGFIVLFVSCILVYIVHVIEGESWLNGKFLFQSIFLILAMCFSGKRCGWLSKSRVRTIIRQYIAMCTST